MILRKLKLETRRLKPEDRSLRVAMVTKSGLRPQILRSSDPQALWHSGPLALRGLIVVAGLLLLFGRATSAHAYTNSRLMDDQVFDNVGSMSETQIQSFLNGSDGRIGHASACLASYTNLDPNYSTSTGWTYTGNVSAAHIIYTAAQQWGLNPQVILATLEKEESLVSGAACDTWRYNSAMGYACPDSGGCDPRYAGFTKQVLWGSYQLKFNKERSYGNTAWDGDDNLVYSGYMTQGTRKRCGTCSSVYYDGYATLDGQSTFLENGTTASLYSYTPHLGQSFPGIFERWFGPTILATYANSYYTQSNYPTLFSGQQTTGSFTYKNTGTAVWYDDSTASANSSLPVHLATSRPINRRSVFGSTWGGPQNRPSLNFASVLNASGVAYGTNPHIVQPGEFARFDFTLSVPAGTSSGVYREFFYPIVEGTANGAMNDPGTYLDVTVQQPIYSPAFAGQSGYLTLLAGQSSAAYFKYRNNGNVAWYDDTSGPGAGQLPTHLATSNPINRFSILGSTWGANHNRAALNFSTVYESDGTTIASNQHIVQPGQIGQMSFTFTVPSNASGFYREYLRPIVEGTPDGAMSDPATYLEVTVRPPIWNAAYKGQSNYPTIARGNSAAAFFKFQNNGNVNWYDDSSISGAPSGSLPTHLATSRPINRSSLFGSSWGPNQNRPALNFAAVYEADGTTLAANQHLAQPGQIVTVSYTFNVPSFAVVGTYREFFQPVLEGSSDGAFNDPGTYIDVTVTP